MRASCVAILSLALLSVAFSFDQTPLTAGIHESSFVSGHSNTIHTAVIYLGESTHKQACFKESELTEGLLVEDYSFQTLCLRIDDDTSQVTFNAVLNDDSEIELIEMGTFNSPMRVIYDYDLELIYASRGEIGDQSTDLYRAAHTNKIRAIFLTALLEAELDFEEAIEANADIDFEIEPYVASWTERNEEYEEVSLEVAQGASGCVTPDFGQLDSIEICVSYDSDGIFVVDADDVEIFTTPIAITADILYITYSEYDNIISISSSEDEDDDDALIVNIYSIQVTFLLNEGLPLTGIDGEVVLEVGNENDPYYDCTSFTNSLLYDSVLYPSVEALCLECDENECEISFLLRDEKKNPTYTTFTMEEDTDEYDQSLEIVLDLEYDQLIFYFSTLNYDTLDQDTYSLTRLNDEIIYWTQVHDDLEYGVIVGGLEDEYTNTEEYTTVKKTFTSIYTLDFGVSGKSFGIYCASVNCYLGMQDADDSNMLSGIKEYEGAFSKVLVYRITEGVDQICLSLYSLTTAEEINDCSSEEQWLLYMEYISQYPLFTIEMDLDTDSDSDGSE